MKLLRGVNDGFEKIFKARIVPTRRPGLVGVLIKSTRVKKPNPKDYSAVVGAHSIVPACQVEVYYLALNKYIREGDRVLDVGFGTGYGMAILGAKAGEIHGADVDKAAYDYSMNAHFGKHPKLKKLSLYDGYKLDYPDGYFDVVTAVEVLEHVEDYHRFLKEMMRVSKRGVFITTPARRPEFTNPDGTPKNHWHLREWNQKELDEIVKQHGSVDWNCIDGRYDGPFTISKKENADTLDLAPFIKKG